MSNLVRRGLGAAIMTALVFGSGTALAEATANVGVTSNYLWRGETQNADQAAVSGGLDFSQGDSGLYAGAWNSSLAAGEGYELDAYAGYKFDLGGGTLDLGAITYQYPTEGNNADFSEDYVGLSGGGWSAKVSYSHDYLNSGSSAYYYEIGAETEVKKDLSLKLHYGWKQGDYFDANTDGGYSDYSVSLVKGEFAILVSNTDNKKVGQTDNARMAVTWTHSLEL